MTAGATSKLPAWPNSPRREAGTSAVVRVDESRVRLTSAGAAWWESFRQHPAQTARIHVVSSGAAGRVVEVICDSVNNAETLAIHMVTSGMAMGSISVRRGAAE